MNQLFTIAEYLTNMTKISNNEFFNSYYLIINMGIKKFTKRINNIKNRIYFSKFFPEILVSYIIIGIYSFFLFNLVLGLLDINLITIVYCDDSDTYSDCSVETTYPSSTPNYVARSEQVLESKEISSAPVRSLCAECIKEDMDKIDNVLNLDEYKAKNDTSRLTQADRDIFSLRHAKLSYHLNRNIDGEVFPSAKYYYRRN